jgi:PAS domain S-box-containing protein
MKIHIPEKLSTPAVKIGILAILTVIMLIITWVCLTRDLQVLFTHLYYVPIIAAAYWFRRSGIIYSLVLAITYLLMVTILGTAGQADLVAAAGRAIVFVGISCVIAILSTIIKNEHEAILVSEGKFRGIWENIQAAIILVDPSTHSIIAANPEAEKLTGFSEMEMQGHLCHRFICPAEEGKCPISDLGVKVEHAERILLARNGKKVPVLKTVTDVNIGGKRVFIESFIDISPVKEAENALLAYLREATLRTRNPVELVRDNLHEIREGLKDRTAAPDHLVTLLAIQEKNTDSILATLQELERAVAEKRTDIPDALREYLMR